MKIEVVSWMLVKPCKPTPPDLRTYKISMIDELNPSMHVIRILFFPSSSKEGLCSLESSLAQVLPHFYPLAGRYNKEQHYVNCNDAGAEYSQAQADCQLSDVVGAESELLNRLLPLDICSADDPTDPMLALRVNRFACGGVAVGICASHRILDSASVGIFITAWANAASGRGPTIRPDFDSPSYFPAENLPPLQFQVSRTRDRRVVSKMFRFDNKAISKLRAEWRSTSTGSGRPLSRVVTVSAVLTQALLRADRARHGRQRASLIAQAINVRERTVPPIPKHSCGTWVSISYLEFDEKESLAMAGDFPAMARKMREANVQGVRDCSSILSDKELGRYVLVDTYLEAAQKAENPNYKVVWVTDWSKFGDYEVDFGFGKPVWVSLGDVPLKDMFILMNTKEGDGIEAWVYLDESDMSFFEVDEVIRLVASSNVTSTTTTATNSHVLQPYLFHSRI